MCWDSDFCWGTGSFDDLNTALTPFLGLTENLTLFLKLINTSTGLAEIMFLNYLSVFNMHAVRFETFLVSGRLFQACSRLFYKTLSNVLKKLQDISGFIQDQL